MLDWLATTEEPNKVNQLQENKVGLQASYKYYYNNINNTISIYVAQIP